MGVRLCATVLLYDRGAILGGEIWRLITGPLVHFSGDHLFFNALLFAAAGFLIERRHTLLFAHLCLARPSRGVSAFFFCRREYRFSEGSRASRPWPSFSSPWKRPAGGPRGSLLWIAVLALTAGKDDRGVDPGGAAFRRPGSVCDVPSVHIAGGLVALGAYIAVVRRRNILFMPSG